MKKAGLSHLSYGLLILLCLAYFFRASHWVDKPVIAWDITLYYSYLPATFIYHDLKFEGPRYEEWSQRQFYMNEDEEGNRYVKMTSGLAMLYAPFFAGAHLYAQQSTEYLADGFSLPYRFALLLSALFFAMAGLFFLRRILLRWFNDTAVALTLPVLFLGSNLPHYVFVEPMAHAYNFFLVCFGLWAFFRYLDRSKLLCAILFGLSAGLLVLIRPTDIVILLFPLAYLLWKRPLPLKALLLPSIWAILAASVVIMPQLAYWQYTTDHWVVYSYNEEGFYFLDPELWQGWFSYRKGWFLYAPVLWLCLPGLWFLWQKDRSLGIITPVLILVASWVTFSWWCWWYGGSFGARAMIDFLPFMAFPLAALFDRFARYRWWAQAPVYVVSGFLCYWSLIMHQQYQAAIIHFDSMSKELYWRQFLKNYYVEDHASLLDPPDYEAALHNEEPDE